MTASKPAGDLPVKLFKTGAAWDGWLARHFDSSDGLWLRIARKSAALESVRYPEVLEIAICHGWIDGQRRALDADSFLQKFGPRGARSIWSKINRDKALALIEAGRMQPHGLAAVAHAKKHGRWDSAYDSHRTSAVPEDLQAALDRNPTAKAFFATLNSQNRYAILFRTQTAKLARTRERRIAKFVEMLARGETLHPV